MAVRSKSFSQNITAFVRKTKLRGDVVIRRLAMDMFLGLLLKSPVDTGRFRANWRVAINRVDLTTDGGTNVEATKAKGSTQIAASQFGDTINISNNLPYAEALEVGRFGRPPPHSKQAPQGVMRITFEEVRSAFAATVRSVVGEIP